MTKESVHICSVPEALQEIREGKVLALVDDENDHGQGALLYVSKTPDVKTLRFLASMTQGFICMAVRDPAWKQISLPDNLQTECIIGAVFPTATDSRFARENALASPLCVVPFRVGVQGVLRRPGYAECGGDLNRLAGMDASCFFATFTQREQSVTSVCRVAELHSLKVLSITELIRYRMTSELHVREGGVLPVTSRYGRFRFVRIECDVFPPTGVLVKGNPEKFCDQPPLVRIERIHMADGMCTSPINCLGRPLEQTLELMYRDGRGLVLFIPSMKPRSFNELTQLLSMKLFEDDPFSTLEDSWFTRTMTAAFCGQILRHFRTEQVRIVSSRPWRLKELEGVGIRII